MKIRPVDIVINIICLVLILGSVAYVVVSWRSLPEQVPTNYSPTGEITGYSSKLTLLIMPITMIVTYIIITVVRLLPKSWNTGVKVTARNREAVYRIIANLLISTNLVLTILFASLTVFMCRGEHIPGWFIPIELIAIFGVPGFWLVQLFRNR